MHYGKSTTLSIRRTCERRDQEKHKAACLYLSLPPGSVFSLSRAGKADLSGAGHESILSFLYWAEPSPRKNGASLELFSSLPGANVWQPFVDVPPLDQPKSKGDREADHPHCGE